MLSWKIGSNAACPPNPGSASERPSREWGLDKILQNRLGLWAVHKCAQRAVVRTNSRSRIWKGIHDKGMIMTQRGIKTKYKNQKKNLQASKKGDPGGPGTVEEQVTLMVSSFSTSSFSCFQTGQPCLLHPQSYFSSGGVYTAEIHGLYTWKPQESIRRDLLLNWTIQLKISYWAGVTQLKLNLTSLLMAWMFFIPRPDKEEKWYVEIMLD